MRCMWCGSVVGQVQRTRASTESARVMSFPLGAVKDGAAGQRGNAVLTKTPRMQPSKHVHSTLVRFALGFFFFVVALVMFVDYSLALLTFRP